MSDITKCFALSDNNKCNALNVKKCKGNDKCHFFKTKEQSITERNAAYARISAMPYGRQQYIADTYYAGKFVWKEALANDR